MRTVATRSNSALDEQEANGYVSEERTDTCEPNGVGFFKAIQFSGLAVLRPQFFEASLRSVGGTHFLANKDLRAVFGAARFKSSASLFCCCISQCLS
jgi:hypothetical protein